MTEILLLRRKSPTQTKKQTKEPSVDLGKDVTITRTRKAVGFMVLVFPIFQGCVCDDDAATVETGCDYDGSWELAQSDAAPHGQEYHQKSHSFLLGKRQGRSQKHGI